MEIVYTGALDPRLLKDAIGSTICEIIGSDRDAVYLDADLMSCIATTALNKESERAINCGIAEANMIGIACGLASAGFKPIVHSFGPFVSRRVFDQIFLSGGYAGNAITVIGTDPGVTAAFNGGTHMPFEDVALYRAIPGAVVVDISDVNMLIDILWQFKDMDSVKYLRVGRKQVPKIYADGCRFEIGKGKVLREGGDAVIIACGIMVHEALKAAAELKGEGIDASVIDMFTIKPLDAELLLKYAEKTGAVVTAENHNRIGGLFSAVCEVLIGKAVPVGHVAVEDCFGEVGPQDYLQERFGLTAEHIVQAVKATLCKK